MFLCRVVRSSEGNDPLGLASAKQLYFTMDSSECSTSQSRKAVYYDDQHNPRPSSAAISKIDHGET